VTAHARRSPARPALRECGRTVTYAELDWAAGRLRDRLREGGVRPGDRVAVHGDPGVATVVALLAVLGARAVWTGLNPRYALREIDDVVAMAAPRVLLSAGPARPGLDDLAVEAGAHLLRLDEDGQVEGAAAGTHTDVPEVVVPAGTGALVFTSGSTGAPKGALIPSAALAGCCEVAARRWAADLDVVLCDLPVNHVGFLGDIVGTALVAGATVVLAPRFDPGHALRLIAEERVTAWTGVPAMFAAALAEPALHRTDLTSVRRVLWGGAAMPAGLLPALAAVTPAPLTSVYGTTETVGNVADLDSTRVTRLSDLAGSLGRAVAPYRIRVVDDTGTEAGDDEDGLVEVLTPHGFSGYLTRPEATAAVRTPDGWLRTGDLARRAPDGSLTYLGRADGLFKNGGYFVNPAEVEDQIQRLPGVVEAAVVPLPDPDRGAVPGALVVASGSPPLEGDTLRAALRRVLAPYKVPRTLRVVPALPRLPLGKVDRAAVAATLQGEDS
jgi:fatty-acyl-CoA synthase